MHRIVSYAGRYHSGVLSGAAGADAATAGRIWLINEVGSTVLVGIRKVILTPLVPGAQSTAHTRITAERMTFTGTASGASGTPAAYDSAQTLSSSVSIRTASTGLTPVAGAVLAGGTMGWQIPATPAGSPLPDPYPILDYAEHEGPFLRAGEGLVVRQADAGDTDQRFMVDIDFTVFTYSRVR